MSGRDGCAVEAQPDRGYSLCGRRVEYVSPELSRHSGGHARVTAGVPCGSATGNDDRGGMGVVPKSPARIDDINDVFGTFLSVLGTFLEHNRQICILRSLHSRTSTIIVSTCSVVHLT